LRGINKQVIFEDEDDYSYFMSLLMMGKEVCGYELLAYCLMTNHIHLLIRLEETSPGEAIKRLASKYAWYFNNKYERVGHLFQDRFRSEVVDDEAYAIGVTRYIHKDPLEAKLVRDISDYPFSSYGDYLASRTDSFTDTAFILSLLGGTEEFISYHEEDDSDKYLDITESRFLLSDEHAIKLIIDVTGCKTPLDMQKLDITTRNEEIRKLKQQGLSIRQLARLTGISKSVIERQ
jgi:REP element-mobilizing transposase RayT